MRRIARILAGLLVLSFAAPAIAEVTDEDLDRVRSEISQITAESQALGDAVQRAWARQAELEQEIARLQGSIEFARVQIVQTEERLEEVAVEIYMGSTSTASLSMLLSAESDELSAGLQYLREVSGVDGSVITELRVFRRQLDQQTERLAEASAEAEILTAELQQMAAQLLEELGEAQQLYDQLVEQQRREEEERRRAAEEAARRAAEEAARHATTTTVAPTTTTTVAPTTTAATATGDEGDGATTTVAVTTTTTLPPSSPGNGACPVAGAVSFTDSWGAPRSGGRSHKGVDMIASRGTPIVAIYDAVIRRISVNNLGGYTLWLRADNGDEFYYAHMDAYGDISVGQRVPQGYVVGYNGSSGNSPDWLPHLHLEWHPDGGAAVNPYPLVKSLCG